MVSIGAHWGVLQIAAWASMVSVYSAEKGLVVGLKETFDGEHPCAMCKKISTAKGKDSQQNSPLPAGGQSEVSKWLATSLATLLPRPHWEEGATVVQRDAWAPHFYDRYTGPPVPPPKIAA